MNLRRRLLRGLLLAGLAPHAAAAALTPQPQKSRCLVLLELSGGNDALNTLVPYRDPRYRALRPQLALPVEQLIALDDQQALHPALAPLLPAWRGGDLAWLRGLGYPAPNRSHFRSIDIWERGSVSASESRGWLARLADEAEPTASLAITLHTDDGPFRGAGLRSTVIDNPLQFVRRAARLPPLAEPPADAPAALRHLLRVHRDTRAAAAQLSAAQGMHLMKSMPRTRIGADLAAVASMIISGRGVSLFKIRQHGYDSHTQQLGQHAMYLADLAEALAAFRVALQASGDWSRVTLASYAEFGRRPAENASGGTDHGTASCHFLLGGGVRGGLHGALPELPTQRERDLDHRVDFRQYYDQLAAGALGWRGQSRLAPQGAPRLNLFA